MPNIDRNSSFRGKDGIIRDFAKLKMEFALMRDIMRIHWRRYRKAPWDSHAYMNLFVESRRASPYLTGHVDCWFYSVCSAHLIWEIYSYVTS